MSGHRTDRAEPVVVTGTGVLCSIGHGVAEFTDALREGRGGIIRDGPLVSAPLPGFDFAGAVASQTGVPEPVRRLAIRTAARSPLAVRAAVVAALEAWADAGLPSAPLPGQRVGVVVGGNNVTGGSAFQAAVRFRDDPVSVPGRYALHMQDTDHVGVLSQVLDITGEGHTVGGASASGNLAIIHGVRMIQSGATDACLVVGALTELSALERRAYLALGAMADPTGGPDTVHWCRPFDAARCGFVPGEGSAALVLESACSARRRGVRVLAHLPGHAMRLSANSLADPSEDAEVAVMAAALERAHARPDQLGYVNAHGTASPLGDAIEAQALLRLLGSGAAAWVNATKALTGHCLCAAGVVEAVATIAQMASGFLHGNIHLAEPVTGDLRFVGPKAEPARVDLAISNSFGFGGLHSAVVFATEEAAEGAQ